SPPISVPSTSNMISMSAGAGLLPFARLVGRQFASPGEPLQMFHEGRVQTPAIFPTRRSALAREAQQRLRYFSAIGLLNLHVPGVLEFGKVARQITLVQLRLPQQVKEITLLDRREQRDYHHSPGLMNHPVQCRDGAKLLVHGASASGSGLCRMNKIRVAAP